MHADQRPYARLAYTITTDSTGPERFFGELTARGVDLLLDVRPYPRQDVLWARPAALADAAFEKGIRLVRVPGLVPPQALAHPPAMGGAWVTFRDLYIDHLGRNLADLEVLKEHVRTGRVALLCDCADPRRCHRGILTERLVVAGVPSTHLFPVLERAVGVEATA